MAPINVNPLPNPPMQTDVTQQIKQAVHPEWQKWFLKLTQTINNITGGGSGTVTTSGSPMAGNLTVFSAPTVITNGNLSGDVTTSGTLTTTITNNAVTLAKLQQISSHRILGRNSAGTGDVEQITISQALDWLTV